jgi:transposase, IS5 family
MKNINSDLSELFDEQFQLERLTQLKDPLVKLAKYIDWKIFAPILDVVLNKHETIAMPEDRLLIES